MGKFDIDIGDFGLDKIDKLKIEAKGNIDTPKASLKISNFDNQAGVDAIKDAVNKTITNASVDLKQKLAAAMASSAWGEMGDIIDSGDLRDSLNLVINGSQIEVSYDSPYANLIHYGGYIVPYGNNKVDKVYIPGRPWVEAVFTGNGPVDPIDVPDIWNKSK